MLSPMKRSFVVKDVKPYSMKQLCEIYQISDKTLRKWLKPYEAEIGKRQGHIFTVAQVVTIFSNLGVPGVLE